MADDALRLDAPLPPGFQECPDGEFIAALQFAEDAAPAFRKAQQSRDLEMFWRVVAGDLAMRRGAAKQKGRPKLDGDDRRRLLTCGLPADERKAIAGLVQIIDRPKTSLKKSTSAYEELCLRLPDAAATIIALDVLIDDGASLDPALLSKIYRDGVIQSAAVEAWEPETIADEFALAEIEFKAGHVLGAIAGADTVHRRGRDRLRELLDEHTDTDGTPHGRILPELELIFASLVRSIEFAARVDTRLRNRRMVERFADLVSVVARLIDRDGTLGSFVSGDRLRGVLATARTLSGLKKGSLPGRLINEIGSAKKKANAKLSGHDDVSVQSDWARIALLRASWKLRSDTLLIEHAGAEPFFELRPENSAIISGSIPISATVDGKTIEPDDEWECVCTHSDDDGDYVELFLETGGVKFGRQFYLSRAETCAVLVDSACAKPANEVRVDTRLPLVAGAAVEAARPIRELRLAKGKQRMRLIPAGLPDRREISTAGHFREHEGTLELSAANYGVAFSPLVIDWSPERRRKPVDWRLLTTAEEGRELAPHEATACRVRIGDFQLVVYRRFDESKEMRTVLGMHHNNETVIGQFMNDGEINPLLLVE
ncbi:hypothetical protein [Stratiformator vulcanicus]|uniref:Heparinase II/III-like protein n=1 Tax=Stratiformator vulcanicus TaxID=2527980 RepID=A0A517R6M8_9PLAN|nr:hypothetical protein [Stratiformator vulcanicus]QDT39557.1 hypothetical protein Pan189_39660 [Stratiformator vulcanicus]